MLRLYKPISDDIFRLQDYLEFLVCDIWCGDQNEECENYLNLDLKPLYDKYNWFREDINLIFTECKKLTLEEKEKIKNTFLILKNIGDICESKTIPLKTIELPNLVGALMKPFFIKCYESLLDRSLVPGDKLKYYNSLITQNEFKFCPCCGYISFESADSNYREAYDHYLPKSDYPFASVNFLNLVPLCYKCNSDRKNTKNPVQDGRKTYYPFSDNYKMHDVEICLKFSKNDVKNYEKFQKEDMTIELIGDNEKCNTWDDVFDIKDRYNDEIRSLTKALMKLLKKKFERENPKSYLQIVDDEIDDFEDDKFADRKFLKIAFLNELKNCEDIMNVYRR